jgi:hypothetical protein
MVYLHKNNNLSHIESYLDQVDQSPNQNLRLYSGISAPPDQRRRGLLLGQAGDE